MESLLSDSRSYVRIGLEIGEHGENYRNLIDNLKSAFDISKVDFVLIYTKPVAIPEEVWYEWAKYFSSNDVYFAFLYTQQRGAPKGKTSHLTSAMVAKMREIAGNYFVGDMIGETGGLASWQEGYYEDLNMEKPSFDSLEQAKTNYVDYVRSRVELDRNLGIPDVLAVEATALSRYNFQAGVDSTFIEMMCGNPEVILASGRGASKAYGRKYWGSHIALEWYGGLRNEDPLKYMRLKLAYYYSYIAGANYIYPESGHFGISSYGMNAGMESEQARLYRSVWNESADFIHLHERPEVGPLVSLGVLQGDMDSWTGWGGSSVWNNFGKDEWVYGPSERGWDYLPGLGMSEKWHVPTVYGSEDMTASVPYGQYDIVPVEAPLGTLRKYGTLIMLGWNTMTAEVYEKLKEYVLEGGRLFMSIPHLNTSAKREGEMQIINNGDLTDLFGCVVKGRGREINSGMKFINNSQIAGCLYPYTPTGICDPICANGKVMYADVEVKDAKVIAVAADRFMKWSTDSPPLMLEKQVGKGFTTLLCSWDYPGAVGLEKFMRVVLKALTASEKMRASLIVDAPDSVSYAVYKNSENDYVVYLLNTNYSLPSVACIKHQGGNVTLGIETCEIRVVNICESVICSPVSSEAAVKSICCKGEEIELTVSGRRDVPIDIFGMPKGNRINRERVSVRYI